MKNKLKILHQILYHEDDYNNGQLVIIILKEDAILDVMAIKYVYDYFYCPEFNVYKFGGIGSN